MFPSLKVSLGRIRGKIRSEMHLEVLWLYIGQGEANSVLWLYNGQGEANSVFSRSIL